MVLPCGSSTVRFGITQTCAFMPKVYQFQSRRSRGEREKSRAQPRSAHRRPGGEALPAHGQARHGSGAHDMRRGEYSRRSSSAHEASGAVVSGAVLVARWPISLPGTCFPLRNPALPECFLAIYSHRANQLNEFLQKLIGVHEHGKVSTVADCHKLLAWGFDEVEVLSSQRGRSRKVLSTFYEEHRDRKFKSELLRPAGFRLGDELFPAQHLAINGIIDILHGITWS